MFLLYAIILLNKQIKVEREGKHESSKANKKFHHNSKNLSKISVKTIDAPTCSGSPINTPEVCQTKYNAVEPAILSSDVDAAGKEKAIEDFITACGATACKTSCSTLITGKVGGDLNQNFLNEFQEECNPSEATPSSSTEGSDEEDNSNSPSSEGKNEGGKPDDGNSTKRVTIFLLLISMIMTNILI
jgi:hypothetical protein